MTAALPSWERISPGLQPGMLPFMAASARCRWLACTRRYLLAALQRRWLTQLQQATGRVLWGRKAQCERAFERRLWLFLPCNTSLCVGVWKDPVLIPLWLPWVAPQSWCLLFPLQWGSTRASQPTTAEPVVIQSARCQRASEGYLILDISLSVQHLVCLPAYQCILLEWGSYLGGEGRGKHVVCRYLGLHCLHEELQLIIPTPKLATRSEECHP